MTTRKVKVLLDGLEPAGAIGTIIDEDKFSYLLRFPNTDTHIYAKSMVELLPQKTPLIEVLANRISVYQEIYRINDNELCRLCSLSSGSIKRIKDGRGCTLDTLDKIADGLNTTPAELLSDDND